MLIAEGIHLAEEVLASGAFAELAVVSPRLERLAGGAELKRQIGRAGIPIEEATDEALEAVQDARSPQPVVMLVRRPAFSWETVWSHRPGPCLMVVAHALQDPGNLGSLVRSADAAGATALVACGDGADLYHPRTVRASMGSLLRLPATQAPLEDLLARLRSHEIDALGTDATSGTPFHEADLTRPLALFFGTEGRGLPRDLSDRLDGLLRIPMRPEVDSLSVGAAAAVVLFEAARQRRAE